MADGECAAHIGHGDLGDMTIETGGERGEQHAEQADHDARAERLGGGAAVGVGWPSGVASEVIATSLRRGWGNKAWAETLLISAAV